MSSTTLSVAGTIVRSEEMFGSSIAASIQRALMPPLEDSPGVRLLKKMGWRPGQGVGPRVSWRTRKIQDLLAAGKSINGVDIDALDDDDEEAKRHMYPPRDTVVPRFSMKSDSYGVGYTAGPGLVESLGQKRPEVKGPKLAGERCLVVVPSAETYSASFRLPSHQLDLALAR